MDGWGIALDVQAAVPDEMDFGFVWGEFQSGVDLDGGAVMYSGHFAAVQSGGGGKKTDVERAREKRASL